MKTTKLLPFTILTLLSGFFLSCLEPVSFDNVIPVYVELPEWPKENFPELEKWEISCSTKDGTNLFYASADSKSVCLNVKKDSLSAFLVKPVTNPDFFFPAGAVYPVDRSQSVPEINETKMAVTVKAEWEKGFYTEALKQCFEKQIDVSYFNWEKLRDTLVQKDADSFEKFDSLKTKTCALTCNTNMDELLLRIQTPPSRFTVPYFSTSSVLPSKIKNLKLGKNSVILFPYIPANNFYKEKGYLTVQTEPKNYKTAFLLDNKIIYVQNKKLVSE